MKRILCALCALALTAALAGCGATAPAEKAAAETPAVTEAASVTETTAPGPETQLALELVGNYLTMAKPQHESIQYRFGLETAEKHRPIYRYEDYSYTENGDAAAVKGYYSVADLDHHTPPEDAVEDYMDVNFRYPETTCWKTDDGTPFYSDWVENTTYYFTNINGESAVCSSSSVPYQPMATDAPLHYGFAALLQKDFKAFLREADPGLFTLTETTVYDMETRQEKYNIFEASWQEYDQHEQAREEWRSTPDRPCYAVSLDVPQEYLDLYNLRILDSVFSSKRSAYAPDEQPPQESFTLEEYLAIAHPVKTRLEEGMVHVSLYFDMETKQCIGRRLDATDCAGALMDQLCVLELVKPMDRSFVVEEQYFDSPFTDLPAHVEHQETTEPNQAVFWAMYGFTEQELAQMTTSPDDPHHQVYTTSRFDMAFNVKTGFYEIGEGGAVAAVMQKYSPTQFSLPMNNQPLETLTSKGGLQYEIYIVPMARAFGPTDPNPEQIGYVAIFVEEDGYEGIQVWSWDRDTLEDVMDDLTFTTREAPKLWQW